jgi:hypothetical protein
MHFLIPGTKMGKSSKKGRLTGEQRKSMNKAVVSSVMDGELEEDILFGRVLRHLGAGHVRVLFAGLHPDGTNTLPKEGIAKIRTALARRGSTPIVADDIVVLSGRSFETLADEKPRFDLMAVMTRAEAAKLERNGKIPSWLLQTGNDTKVAEAADDLFEYLDPVKEGESDSSSDGEVDIDKI